MTEAKQKEMFQWGSGSDPEVRIYLIEDVEMIDPIDGVCFLDTLDDGREVFKICEPDHLNGKRVNLYCQMAIVADENGVAHIAPEFHNEVIEIGQPEIQTGDFFRLNYQDSFFRVCKYLVEKV